MALDNPRCVGIRRRPVRQLVPFGPPEEVVRIKNRRQHDPLSTSNHELSPESRTLGPGPNELGGLLVQAGLGSARDHASIALLSLNGLPISEALGADFESMDMDRNHRISLVLTYASR